MRILSKTTKQSEILGCDVARVAHQFWRFATTGKHTTDDTTTTTTRDKKNAPCAIARPIPRVECVASGHDGAVVFVSRARSFVWCVTPRGAGAFKSQAAAAAWWDVAWYVGRAKRHGVGF